MRLNLKNVRKKKGLKQAEIAKILNITIRQYQSIEAGASYGSVKLWEQLSELLGETINYLLVKVEVQKKPDGNQAKEISPQNNTTKKDRL